MRHALAAALLGSSLLVLPVRADEIVLRDGRRITDVKVTEESYETIRYTIADTPQQIEASEVAEIVRSEENKPASLLRAEKAMAAGQFVEAAERYLSAARVRTPGWVRQHGYFYAAEAYRLANRLDEAARTYEKLLAEVPTTRFLPQARIGLARCKLAQGDYAGARTLLQKLQEEARSKKLGRGWELAAELEIARSWELEGDKRKAARIYRSVATRAVRDPAVAAQAQLGAIRTQGDDERALRDLEALIDADKTPDSVRAEAYLERGRRLEKLGRFQQALLSYLRVAYDPPLQPFAAARAEALYRAAKVIEKAGVEDASERAAALERELKRSFPESRWAAQL